MGVKQEVRKGRQVKGLRPGSEQAEGEASSGDRCGAGGTAWEETRPPSFIALLQHPCCPLASGREDRDDQNFPQEPGKLGRGTLFCLDE